jgi:hypothetical protein
MKSSILIFVCLVLVFSTISLAEELCPGLDKLPAVSGADELKMYEKDFNIDRAMKSVKYLEEDVITIIQEHKGPHSVLQNERFYISYPNSLTFVKGTLLKQEALIAKNVLELEKLKFKNGANNKEDFYKAAKAYNAKKKKFCDFLKTAEYDD